MKGNHGEEKMPWSHILSVRSLLPQNRQLFVDDFNKQAFDDEGVFALSTSSTLFAEDTA